MWILNLRTEKSLGQVYMVKYPGTGIYSYQVPDYLIAAKMFALLTLSKFILPIHQ